MSSSSTRPCHSSNELAPPREPPPTAPTCRPPLPTAAHPSSWPAVGVGGEVSGGTALAWAEADRAGDGATPIDRGSLPTLTPRRDRSLAEIAPKSLTAGECACKGGVRTACDVMIGLRPSCADSLATPAARRGHTAACAAAALATAAARAAFAAAAATVGSGCAPADRVPGLVCVWPWGGLICGGRTVGGGGPESRARVRSTPSAASFALATCPRETGQDRARSGEVWVHVARHGYRFAIIVWRVGVWVHAASLSGN